MTKTARRRCVAVLVTFTLFAAACGGGDDGGGQGSPTTAVPPGDPQPGGEITYGLDAETGGGFCLPEAQLAISGIQVARTVYDTLTAPNEDGEIVPYLAQSVEPNDDYSQWTITLRDGVTFHDGSPLDAEIVKDNLDAYRGQYSARDPLLFLFVYDNIASVEVVDPLTVRVTTTVPWVAFHWHLWSGGRTGIMGRAQLDAADTECANNLIGTGPFVLDHWTVNEELVANKNPDYWQTDADGTTLPYLDRITYLPIPEVAQRINALEGGQIDVMHTDDGEQISQRLRPLHEAGTIQITESDAFSGVSYIMLNVSTPPFDNKDARLALAHAFDRELFNAARRGGIATIADGPFQEDAMGFTDDTGIPQYDPQAAEAAAAAYEDETGQPLEFTMTFQATEANSRTAQELQAQFSEVGITMNLDPSGDEATNINRMLEGDFEATALVVNHTGPDPDTQYMWWDGGSPLNFGRIDDPEIDRLLDEGRSATEGRDEIYQQLNQRFGSEVYNIWATYAVRAVAAQPAVQGTFGSDLPDDGGGPFPGLGTGHMVHGMWLAS